ncbi:hypothetical protein, partial [Streptomyces sp. NPDC086519]|uniref:hypothetical protein n=1 Tax=Streptomyces sp. NPDC086519 TaxID=3154863 RepID=UPI0034351D2C
PERVPDRLRGPPDPEQQLTTQQPRSAVKLTHPYGGGNPISFSDPSGKGLACGPDFGVSCGNGVVTHGDGSLSKNGNPTGGGVAPGYAGMNSKSSTGTAHRGSGDDTKQAQDAQAAARGKAATARADRLAAMASDQQKSCGFVCGLSKLAHGFLPHGEGLCGSFGFSAALSVSGSVCLVSIKGPDGKRHSTLTGSWGVGLGFFGFSAAGDTVYTNADDVSQLTGWGASMEGTAGEGLLGHAAVGTGGSRNSHGSLVYMGQIGLGAGVDLIPPGIPVNVTGGVSDTFVLHQFN